MFSSPRGDFIILTYNGKQGYANDRVFVPSRGFHYINKSKLTIEQLYEFSSPRGDFIILTNLYVIKNCFHENFRPLAGISLY